MTLLVVDDNKLDRTMLEKLLRKNGFMVVCASDGDEGLKILKAEEIDLALVDWMMPPTGGLSICKQVREHESSNGGFCYLIVVTAKNEPKDQVKALEAGANDFISKPFEESVLIARVKAGIRIVGDRRALFETLERERD